MGSNIRVDAKTGETFELLGNGEKVLPPQATPFIGPKKVPATGLRQDNAERVRRMNSHLPNSQSNK